MAQPERREFLEVVTGTLEGGALNAQTRSGETIYRTLGKTGERVSAIGLGGQHIGRPQEEKDGIRIVRRAIDRGINFMDNCWDYHNGKSEVWMGHALRDGYRQKVFPMTKFDDRTRAATAKQVDESLQRLETDHIDLMHYHENIRMEDPDRFLAPEGPLEARSRRRRRARFRYIGFTGHKDPVAHLRTLRGGGTEPGDTPTRSPTPSQWSKNARTRHRRSCRIPPRGWQVSRHCSAAVDWSAHIILRAGTWP